MTGVQTCALPISRRSLTFEHMTVSVYIISWLGWFHVTCADVLRLASATSCRSLASLGALVKRAGFCRPINRLTPYYWLRSYMPRAGWIIRHEIHENQVRDQIEERALWYVLLFGFGQDWYVIRVSNIYIYITTYKRYNFSIPVVCRIDNITYRKYKDLISEKPLIFFLILWF